MNYFAHQGITHTTEAGAVQHIFIQPFLFGVFIVAGILSVIFYRRIRMNRALVRIKKKER